MSVQFYEHCIGIVWRPCGFPTIISRNLPSLLGPKDYLKPCVMQRAMPVRRSFNVALGLRFFKICRRAELNKIIEATMLVYNNRKVSLWWPYGKGDHNGIVQSESHRKANVTEALKLSKVFNCCLTNMITVKWCCTVIFHSCLDNIAVADIATGVLNDIFK